MSESVLPVLSSRSFIVSLIHFEFFKTFKIGILWQLSGKESACHAGDPSSIPGLGRSSGEGVGHPLQYSWASLVAQLVKNLPVMQETPVRFLGQEDPLEKGYATHASIHELSL